MGKIIYPYHIWEVKVRFICACSCLHVLMCTEPRKSLCTWLREIVSCSCLTFLPGPLWVLLRQICKDFFSASVHNGQINLYENIKSYQLLLSTQSCGAANCTNASAETNPCLTGIGLIISRFLHSTTNATVTFQSAASSNAPLSTDMSKKSRDRLCDPTW